MPTIEEIAALLCSLKDLKRIEYARCDAAGNVCVPASIPCCDDKSVELSLSEMLGLMDVASNNCCPEELDLLGQILETLLDDVETSNYTVLCSSTDPAVTYLAWFEQPDSTGGSAAIVPYHMVLGTDTPIEGMPPDGIRCPDTKIVESCFVRNAGGNEADDIYYTRLLCLFNSTVVSTLWVTPAGTITTTAPTGVIPCENEVVRDVELVEICGTVAGVKSSGYLELIYNADGSLFASRTLSRTLAPIVYSTYDVGACESIKDPELVEICGKNGLVRTNGFLEVVYNPDGTIASSRTLDKQLVAVTYDSYDVGVCVDCTSNIDTCFLPDQYAIQWAWNGTNGALQSYDVITGDWTQYCNLVDETTGLPVVGFALAFENNLTEPRLWFQTRTGQIYYASPLDPCGTLTYLGPSGLTAMPCFDFDPSGRLLIGNGRQVWEINQSTGAASLLGTLIDARTGGNLNAGPGDWMFGPDGSWYMMATDPAGSLYGLCTGTVLWKIDPATLITTRISTSCSPVNGTGATWLAGGQYLLSTGTGIVYRYNEYEDVWTTLTTAPNTINDLAAQWIIPDPIRVSGKITWNDEGCETELFSLTLNEAFQVECNPFVIRINGKFGVCEKEANPFVTDPLDPGSGGGGSCDRCPDEVWQLGCSDAGPTQWRRSFDPSGNVRVDYIYGGIAVPSPVAPPGFNPIPCAEIPIYPVTVTEFCNLDAASSVYRREENGIITWFNETGTITEPVNLAPGKCEGIDPNVETIDTTICLDGAVVIRREVRTFAENDEGLLELISEDVFYFNETGGIWNSNTSTTPEPTDWYLGQCALEYVSYENERLCEFDDEKLLLVDSGGAFAEYSFYTGELTPIAIPVPSAATGSNYPDFLLYALTTALTVVTIDVNTKTIVSTVPLIPPVGQTTVGNISAGDYSVAQGKLFNYDYVRRTLVSIDPVTGVMTDVAGPFTGISGSGSSLMINPLNDKFYVSGSLGRIYEIDPTGVNLVATLVYTSISGANGATFDKNGNLYLGTEVGNSANYGEVYKISNFPAGPTETVVEDWAPGVNSIGYYVVEAARPSCFNRLFGVKADGTRDLIGDYEIIDGTPRTIGGYVDCCGCGDSGPVEVSNFPTEFEVSNLPVEILCDGSEGYKVESTKSSFTYWSAYNITNTLGVRRWDTTEVATQPDLATSSALREAFDLTVAPTSVGTAATLAINDLNNTALVRDYEVTSGYIVVKDPVLLRYSGASEGYVGVEIGFCCGGELEVVAESYNNATTQGTPSPAFRLTPGIHQIRIWNIDVGGSNSSRSLDYSFDNGATWTTNGLPPGIQLSELPPGYTAKIGYLCDGDYLDSDNAPLTDIGSINFLDKPTCCAPEKAPQPLEISNFPTEVLCDGSTGYVVENVKVPYTYWSLEGVTPGLNIRRWNTTETLTPSLTLAQARALREAFNLTVAPTSTGVVTNLNYDDQNFLATTRDYEVTEGYIVVNTPYLARYSSAIDGYWAVELAQCDCGKYELLADGIPLASAPTSSLNTVFSVPSGTHRYRFWNIDFNGANSNGSLQYSFDNGVTWITGGLPPGVTLSTSSPRWEAKMGFHCGGVYYEDDSSTVVTFGSVNFLDKPTCCKPSSSTTSTATVATPKVCTPGYRLITGNQTWTPPTGTTSVSISVVRGTTGTLTTPNGSGVIAQGTSMSWSSNEFGAVGFTGFSVNGVATNAIIQITFIVCV